MEKENKINSLEFICNFVLDYIYKFEQKDENGFSNIDVNNIKFQKILYFLYGIYWKETKKEIFEPNFKAWKFGPVIEEIYNKVQNLTNYNGYAPVPKETFNKFNNEDVFFDKEIVEKIINKLNGFSVWRLVEMSHLTKPWIDTKQSEKISKKIIQNYFNSKNINF